MEIAWGIVGVVVALLVGVGVSMLSLSPPEFTIARACFLVSALVLGGTGLFWELRTEQPTWWRISAGILIWTCVGVGLPETLRWVSRRQAAVNSAKNLSREGTAKLSISAPSLVFVIGAPLGDNAAATWIMMLKHYGPESAYNCNVSFYDDDRKNIEHLWLVNHGSPPFLPIGQFDESQKMVYVAEAEPEGSLGIFMWKPINPNSQHYTVSISCRAGVFVEKWEVTRVNGTLRAMVVIEHGPQWLEKNPTLNPIVFRCQDPEFVRTALATEVPKSSTAKVVHPGWKPNYRFEVPAAIIDPNGHIQMLSGVKAPDGSTITDFGCWNILTRHFGDDKAKNETTR